MLSTRLRFLCRIVLILTLATTASATTITFDEITAPDGSGFSSYTESGFTVTPTFGNWVVSSRFGRYIQFHYSLPGPGTDTASVAVTDAGSTFTFNSLFLYSSVTPIPWTFTGLLSGNVVFTVSGTVPVTFGNFALAQKPASNAMIDALQITLFNPLPGPAFGPNPVGLDNIVVNPVPEPRSSLLLVGLLVVMAGLTAEQAFLDVAMVVALISFVGTVAYARYIERDGS